MYLVRKYTNFKRLHLKESSKETAEKELDHLNTKIVSDAEQIQF